MNSKKPLLIAGALLVMTAGAATAQVFAPQDMKPGAAAVETATSLPGERPVATTAEPTTIPARSSTSAADAADVRESVTAAGLQRMEVQAMQAAGQIPVRPRRKLAAPQAEIQVSPRMNRSFGIALQHLNQIVTPFQTPEIKTTSVASISVEKGVVYVSTLLTDEIALLIYEKGGDPSQAMSLTLVPDDINPVSVKVDLQGFMPGASMGTSVANNEMARGWEMDQPFLEVVKSSFRELALGGVPDGYGFQGINRIPKNMPHCNLPGFEIKPMQLVTGNSMTIIVSKLTNLNRYVAKVDESKCASDNLIGAATWPATTLAPGQSAELYLAVRQSVDTSPNQRPSVLGGNAANH